MDTFLSCATSRSYRPGEQPACGELSTGEYHAQYERGSGWVWTGGLEARQGVATQDWGSPRYYPETKQ